MIQNKNSMNRSIRSEMSNRVPSWFAQSAAACVLSGESLFGSAQRSGPPTHPSESRTQSAQRDGWTDLANRLRLVTSEEALDGEQDGADVVGRGPLVLEDVEADVAVGVDVGVEARRVEPHLGRLVGVLGGEGEREAVGGALVGGAGRPGDGACWRSRQPRRRR